MADQSNWDRLQDLLESLAPGDQITVRTAAAATGLDVQSCEMVFVALTRADLFTQTDPDVFIRRSLFAPSP